MPTSVARRIWRAKGNHRKTSTCDLTGRPTPQYGCTMLQRTPPYFCAWLSIPSTLGQRPPEPPCRPVICSRSPCGCGSRWFHAGHSPNQQGRVNAEPYGDRCKEPGDAEIEGIDREQSAPGANGHAYCIGNHRLGTAANSLGDEEQPEAHPEAEVSRSDDMEVVASDLGDLCVVAEETYPHSWVKRDNHPNRPAHQRDGACASPGDLASAAILTSAPVGSDHGHDRAAEAKCHRLKDVFEPGAHRISDGNFSPELPGNAGQHRHRKLVIAVFIRPGTPTLRMSANSSQCG